MRTDTTNEQDGAEQTAKTRNGAVTDDRSKEADTGDALEDKRSRGGVVGDDRSKGLGPEDSMKG